MTRRMILAALSAALVAPVAVAQTTTTTRTQQVPARPGRATITPPQEAVPAQDAASRRIGAQATQQPTATGQKGAVDDNLFLMVAAVSGMGEVKLSELGLTKATNPELKQFSQRAIDDHTHANQTIRAMATQRNVELPVAVGPKAQFCLQSLSGLSGEEFDRCYAKAQLVVHMEAIATFEAEAERGRDPQVKALASKLLPTLKEHLSMVKPIAMNAMKAEHEKAGSQGAATTEPEPAGRHETPKPE